MSKYTNIMTDTMMKTAKMLVETSDRLKKMGTMPYGKRKATPAEKKLQQAQALEEMIYGN